MSHPKCWSFVPITRPLRQQLADFAALIPDQYKVDNHGELSGPIHLNFHSTFLLRLENSPRLLDSMRAVVAGHAPIKLKIAEVFFSRVQRTKRSIYCVGVGFQEVEGSALRDLKMRCNDACGGTVKYGGTHHCSVAYVPDREDIIGHVSAIVQQHRQHLMGLELTVASVCLELGQEIVELPFGAAAEPFSQMRKLEEDHREGIRPSMGAAAGGRSRGRPPAARGGAVQGPGRREPSAFDHLRQLHNNCKRDLIKAQVRRGMHVLDVGCGRGGDLGKWKDAGASRVHCVDPDEESLVGTNGVNDRSAYLKFPVTTQLGTVLDVATGEFDIVCYNFSLHYIAPRLAESCAAIAQRLRPGGLLIGICPDYDSIMAMGCPFSDRLGNSFRLQDDTLFVRVADPSAPFYAGGERPEPVLRRQLLQTELAGLGVRLQSWQPMLQRRNGLISDMYSTFVFRKD